MFLCVVTWSHVELVFNRAGLWSRSRRLGLETYQRLVSRKIVNVSDSRSREVDVSVSANYASCPRPIFGQIMQATLIKRTQCKQALDAGGSEALTSSYQISALSLNLAIIIFVNFAVFVLISTSKLPVPSPLLSFILNLTTATYCTIIFHSLR